MAMLRVLVVEDHPLLQQAVRTLLSPHCVVVSVLSRAEEIVPMLHELQPDVLTLDISLPGRSGLDVLPEVRDDFPELGIVVVTNHAHPAYRTEALRRGADELITKDRLGDQLLSAVRGAHDARSSLCHLRPEKQA